MPGVDPLNACTKYSKEAWCEVKFNQYRCYVKCEGYFKWKVNIDLLYRSLALYSTRSIYIYYNTLYISKYLYRSIQESLYWYKIVSIYTRVEAELMCVR